MLADCEHWASAHGIDRLVAGIQADNTPGLDFYRSAGYRDNGVVTIKEVAPQE